MGESLRLSYNPILMNNLLLIIALLVASLPADAGVLLNIDGQDFPGTQVLQYDVGAMVFEVDFLGSHACSGSSIPSPDDGLTLNIDGQYYAISGSITLELGQGSDRLVIMTSSGDLICEADRIFHDSFFFI